MRTRGGLTAYPEHAKINPDIIGSIFTVIHIFTREEVSNSTTG